MLKFENNTEEVQECINKLVEYHDSLVPIIGDELFYVDTEDGKRLSLNEFIVSSFEQEYPEIANGVTSEEKAMMSEGGYDGLTLLSHRYGATHKYVSKYIHIVTKNKERIKLNNAVKEYIKKSKPKLIITTSSFSLIEKELGLDDVESIWFRTDKNNRTEYTCELNPKGTVVYHLFGDAESTRPNWVYDDVSLLAFMHCLHESGTSPVGLTDYLRENEKLLLILGCKLPNWSFQFILYPLFVDNQSIVDGYRKGFWLKESDDEVLSLKSFLNKVQFLSIKQMESVISEVNMQMRAGSDVEVNDDFDVFISHAGEDSQLAIEIAEYLRGKDLRVWIDRNRGNGETEKGGDYLQRIRHGIEHSRYFMPIVTSNYVNKCRQGDFGKETDMAVDWYNNEKNVCHEENEFKVYSLPVVIDLASYNIGKQYNIFPTELFSTNHYYIYTGKSDDIDTFLNHPWHKYKSNTK